MCPGWITIRGMWHLHYKCDKQAGYTLGYIQSPLSVCLHCVTTDYGRGCSEQIFSLRSRYIALLFVPQMFWNYFSKELIPLIAETSSVLEGVYIRRKIFKTAGCESALVYFESINLINTHTYSIVFESGGWGGGCKGDGVGRQTYPNILISMHWPLLKRNTNFTSLQSPLVSRFWLGGWCEFELNIVFPYIF